MKLRTIVTGLALTGLVFLSLNGGGLLRSSHAGPSYQDLALLTSVLHLVRQHYVKDVSERDLVEGALEGMLDTLDPHTSYLSRDLYKEVQRDTKGEFEGLGIEITKRDGYVTIVAPIDGTPAALAGLRARDQIVAVCPDATEESCKSTQDMNLMEAVKLMRGPRGTKILIQIMRKSFTSPQPYTIKRASIRVSSVTMHMIEEDIPYVRLSQFQERTTIDLQEALDAARESHSEFRGLILDMRDNPGGLLDQAVRVADLFLEDGLIVFSEGRGGGNRMDWSAKSDGTEPGYPIVVLVNGGSASASEIVAGALQDHRRALVIGTETFGKGSVQTIIPLEDGSGLRLTTALYYLPSGRSIQEVRIQPDVGVEPYSQRELEGLDKPAERKSFGEEDLEGHFTAEKQDPVPEELRSETKEQRFQRQLPKDRQLTRAIDLLKSWTIFSKLDDPETS
ncbi:MAG: S41 family peptidase [bacterium]|nr:S41 family peptidase [bacterium]